MGLIRCISVVSCQKVKADYVTILYHREKGAFEKTGIQVVYKNPQ